MGGGAGSRTWRALAAAALLLTPACLTPPAVLPAHAVHYDAVRPTYPPETCDVGILTPDGTHLRGVFVPADPGAPVILHLLEATSSVGSTTAAYGGLLRQLADLGFASLMLDYTGVGLSSGERSPENLAADALAMWRFALARAGGDPRRVVVRGTSLGSIAATQLLEHGVRPGALLLHAPVLADTAVERFAAKAYGSFFGPLLALFVKDLARVDVLEQLAGYDGPLLVYSSRQDAFLRPHEQEGLEQAVRRADGALTWTDWTHPTLAFLGHRLQPRELELLASLRELSEEHRSARELHLGSHLSATEAANAELRAALRRAAPYVRHGEPALVAAAFAEFSDWRDALRILWREREVGTLADLSFEDARAALSPHDPGGSLPADVLLEQLLVYDTIDRHFSVSFEYEPDDLQRSLDVIITGEEAFEVGVRIESGGFLIQLEHDYRSSWRALQALDMTEAARRRWFLRLLMRSMGDVQRLGRDPAGEPRVEVLDQGAWRPLRASGVLRVPAAPALPVAPTHG